MMSRECRYEPDILVAALSRGSSGFSDELQAHMHDCAACRELCEVVMMLRRDQTLAEREVTVPSAGQIWWRSAIRARMEAAQRAASPVTWAQGVTAATLLGVVCASGVLAWPAFRRVATAIAGRVLNGIDSTTVEVVPPVIAAMERSLPLVLGVVIAVVIAPLLVLYFALAGDD
jgi:hypothetical protein